MKDIKEIIITQKGLTMAELVIGMAIMTLIIGAVALSLDVGMRSQRFNFDLTANLQDERRIIAIISDEIRSATEITSPVAGAPVADTSLTYRRAPGAAQITISQGENENASTILFTDLAGNAQTMGNGRVQALRFTRNAATPRIITITLTLRNAARIDAPVTTIVTSVFAVNI